MRYLITKKYTYENGKLVKIGNPLEETSLIIKYNKQGRPLSKYDGYSKSVISYNDNGLTT